jgi:uncharacterized protein (DUF433 family)
VESRDTKIESMSSVITSNPEVMHGTPCFAGTRVPAKTLFDCLEDGYSIDEFLEDFPTVTREQVMAVLQEAAVTADRSAMRVAS